ncbi:uncharacterized protein LOC125045007 isoform X2 [Penaeus chinensis]|uniref:uncharacterized protein LOC125045007 isoform X2 n=1 Tax=Penaeus chinensis TaxID=139456 RepID=UPI001FB75713|nr:uncharacterized protein LOC125045007 isoform X2 [Penaeus chinensis]
MALQVFVIATALTAAGAARAQEAGLRVESLGVTEYLRNPCMIVGTRVVDVDLYDHEAAIIRQRQLAFTKISLASQSLTQLHEIVDNECNTDFSLATLPAIPNPFSRQIRNGYRLMERDLLFLAAHVYFTINTTSEASPRCHHESLEFMNHLRAQHVLEEVLSLRLQRESSCGGRAVWSCILINRVSQSLSLLQQLLRVDSSVSADNDLAVLAPQKKRNPLKQKKSPAHNSDQPLLQQVRLPPLSPPDAFPSTTEKHPRKHGRHAHRRHFRKSDMTSFVSCMRHRYSPQRAGPSLPRSRFFLTSPLRRRADSLPLDDSYSLTPSPLSMFRPHKDKTSSFLDSFRLCLLDDYPGDEDAGEEAGAPSVFEQSRAEAF